MFVNMSYIQLHLDSGSFSVLASHWVPTVVDYIDPVVTLGDFLTSTMLGTVVVPHEAGKG